jgi:hypothetical protein
MNADHEQRIGQARRLFNVTILLQGRETPVDVYSSTDSEGQEMTLLLGQGFKAYTGGGVEDIARIMNPVSGARIRRAHQLSIAQARQRGQ